MAVYSVYADLGMAQRTARVYSFSASDDVAAELFVTERLTNRPVELWCYSRCVARFKGKGA